MPGVDAVHICGGVGLRVAQLLGLRKGLVIPQPQSGHGVENIVAGTVHNAAHLGDGLDPAHTLQLGQPADAAAHRGGAAEEHALALRQRQQLIIEVRDHGLVCGDHIFPGLQCSSHIFSCRMQAADGLDHGINGGIVQNILKIMGEHPRGKIHLPAAQHLHHIHIRTLGSQLINAAAYGSEAQ